jgi:branched-subunit amino acid transport protein AzlD
MLMLSIYGRNAVHRKQRQHTFAQFIFFVFVQGVVFVQRVVFVQGVER